MKRELSQNLQISTSPQTSVWKGANRKSEWRSSCAWSFWLSEQSGDVPGCHSAHTSHPTRQPSSCPARHRTRDTGDRPDTTLHLLPGLPQPHSPSVSSWVSPLRNFCASVFCCQAALELLLAVRLKSVKQKNRIFLHGSRSSFPTLCQNLGTFPKYHQYENLQNFF